MTLDVHETRTHMRESGAAEPRCPESELNHEVAKQRLQNAVAKSVAMKAQAEAKARILVQKANQT